MKEVIELLEEIRVAAGKSQRDVFFFLKAEKAIKLLQQQPEAGGYASMRDLVEEYQSCEEKHDCELVGLCRTWLDIMENQDKAIDRQAEELKQAVKFLEEVMPYIECKDHFQLGLITAIGTFLQVLKEKP